MWFCFAFIRMHRIDLFFDLNLAHSSISAFACVSLFSAEVHSAKEALSPPGTHSSVPPFRTLLLLLCAPVSAVCSYL